MKKILIVEDEEHIYNGLKFNLELEGYEIEIAKDGLIAKDLLFKKNIKFDLIILDIMLPGINGFDICYALRKVNNFVPILILTAKNFDKDKIIGLQLGADDYVTKPFNLEELLIRVKALLRRLEWNNKSNSNIILFGDNKIDFDKYIAYAGNQIVKLTNLEFKLLKIFSDNEGKVLSREFLFENAWGIKDSDNLRTIDNFILKFRKTFEDNPSHPKYFHSIRGVGYKFTKNL
jgi:two-component system alkaline phosphatase synthesis response regulator PhoP